jgi:hypothetical protein
MANKRTLKHAINLICDELFAEAVAASLYGNAPQKENSEALLCSIIRMKDDYIRRISHIEPGMKADAYFKTLRENFSKEADEIINHINYL